MNKERLNSVDLLRGLVMVIMALDHVREFFHDGAQQFSPEDLTKTWGLLFFTRWITHFCAPVFMFLAGIGISFSRLNRGGNAIMTRFLLTRGLWLLFLDLVVMNVALAYNFRFEFLFFITLSALGASMIAMAGLIWLPRRIVAIIALAMILFHNTLDGVTIQHPIWNFLHQPGLLQFGGIPYFVGYPLIPWIGVMAAGFCVGDIVHRRELVLRIGAGATIGFFVLRFLNLYGDASPWDGATVMSFFRATKYPPSLLFLLMTLGPALMLLAALDRVRVADFNPLRVFGRVPMFYYLVHFYLIHALAIVIGGLYYGNWTFFFTTPPSLFGKFPADAPPDYGYGLGAVYAVWAGLVIALYWPCKWYMQFKQRSRAAWTSYL
jgi:uncharacterized membrane protein